MNIYDISKKAGVSIATVSRVINGNAYVSERTKHKVLEVMKESGYTPNAFARGLGLNTMKTIGIMCADSSDPYIASAVYFIEQKLKANHYDSLLCCTGFDASDKENYLKLLLSKRTDAIVLVGSNFVEAKETKNRYIRQAALTVPVMIINAALNGDNIYCTLCDDRRAVYDATIALQNSGHKNILFLYNAKSYSGHKKLEGFITAREEALGADFDREAYVHYLPGSISTVKQALDQLYQNGLIFDAIITADDSLAIGALKFARAHNLKIPDEFSIIGYNNSIIAECCDPELTSVDNKLEAVCNHCVNTLMGVLQNEEMPNRTVFSAEIIKRGTTRFN
jgi:LacI family transcriptional regulator/LacI family asc operon transcriptional repressor